MARDASRIAGAQPEGRPYPTGYGGALARLRDGVAGGILLGLVAAGLAGAAWPVVGLRVQAGLNNDRWDLSADFSATNNPNGAWSYGWTEPDSSRFTLGTAYQRVAGLDAWGGFRADDGNPSIAHNGTDATIWLTTTFWEPGETIFHPGPGNERAVVRWTAPSAGSFIVESRFYSKDSGATDVSVLLDNTSLYQSSRDESRYQNRLVLTAGDTLDFTVGYGADGSFGFDSTGITVTISRTNCGNGTPDAGEECDDGNTNPSDGCTIWCTVCGDHVLAPSEECDDGNLVGHDGCNADCTVPVCGDGGIDPGEQCDDGNTTACDGCSPACHTEPLGSRCGDGVVSTDCGEQCDDANRIDHDGCNADCTLPVCGDGGIDPGEQCDDGNTTACDGCSPSCQTEPAGFRCGDGVVSTACGEVCDDGNLVDTDACTAECRLARTAVGTGTPDSCTEAALDAALAAARTVTFNCGTPAVTITISSTKTIARTTVIDGSGRIAISGGNAVRVFRVNPGIHFTVRNLTIANGSVRGSGGGMLNDSGIVTVANSTFSRNTAGPGDGGAISNGGTLTVANSTFCGNTATRVCRPCPRGPCCFGGGGAAISNGGTLTVTNSTIAGNSATFGSGIHNTDTLTLTNSLVISSSGEPCHGAVTDGGHNLQWPGTTCGAGIPAQDPLLDPAGLQDNGGPTRTIALLPDSPAIAAGDPEVCASPPVNSLDQRGYVRPGTGAAACSIGAYEYNSPGPPTTECAGDCDTDGEVTIDELVTLVNVALGSAELRTCAAGNWNGDDEVTIDEIILAVNAALAGCAA